MAERSLLWTLLGRREPPAPPSVMRSFTTADPVLSQELVVEGDAWVVESDKPRVLRLFEVTPPAPPNPAC